MKWRKKKEKKKKKERKRAFKGQAKCQEEGKIDMSNQKRSVTTECKMCATTHHKKGEDTNTGTENTVAFS